MTIKLSPVMSFSSRPWQNGRGTTREIMVGEGWRVSLADIDADGAFSLFPGLKRWLGLAGGRRLTLHGLSQEPCVLKAPGDIVHFDGDLPVTASCHGAPVRAFNLMVRPDMRAVLTYHHEAFTLPTDARFFLLPLSGLWRIADVPKPAAPGMIAEGLCDTRPTPGFRSSGTSECLVASVFHAT